MNRGVMKNTIDSVALPVCSSEKELGRVTAAWSLSRLVAMWNQLEGVVPVKKFTDRRTAVARLWKAAQALTPPASPERDTGHRGANGGASKKAMVLALLDKGATLDQIMAATGWQRHSVRGFLSTLASKGGVPTANSKENGARVYRIA
jgi:DNA-binding IclR family transcriptional regulator